jgi:phosphoribosylanthranilate isomerase
LKLSFTVKICGLSTPETLDAALNAGADMVGFVFFPPSPRHLSLARAHELGARVRGAGKVALTVDADDALLAAVIDALSPDLLQLHGRETPGRVADIRRRFGIPVMKAIGVSSAADLDSVAAYAAVADRILFDAKPPRDSAIPGGNGLAFDWRLIAGVRLDRPWMLSGGLGPDNVAEAIATAHAPGVDVSSGVETAPGVKDPALIASFIARARAAALDSAVTLGSAAKTA